MLIKRVSIVLANWCPHCVPLSLRYAQKMADDFGVPLRVLDIDVPEQLEAADRLVEGHGDWSEDYLIPQVFMEHADGRVSHVFTGFSEAVSATEACWEAFFASSYYRAFMRGQQAKNSESLKGFVERYLSFRGRCSRHCDGSTSFVSLKSASNGVVGAYVCPDSYVSRVIYFSVNPNIDWFRSFLVSQVGEEVVKDRDLRVATRHGWELESDALTRIGEVSPTGLIKEVYWTTYPQTEAEKSRGVFLCSYPEKGRGCGRLFVQNIKSRERLCPKCR